MVTFESPVTVATMVADVDVFESGAQVTVATVVEDTDVHESGVGNRRGRREDW